MLSVILYGRNDNHGYNLHKRAAISLNAIAHLLNDPTDEIVFVDYNTPDDLPTFPEAIADTLTDKAIDKLRVLRVRPAVHNARFAPKTHLNALEPIARNVAIRRSNPANRWVLSTNTDMIFVPRHEGQDLTRAIGSLEDGFYHLPRFELPEGLWETLDRKDPVGMIAAAKEWGERFHLNEVISSGADNLYDGPGDFQLFLREDLFAIHGFHEEMIRGWHLDANVARRMRMLRGKVSSALDRLVGYHCDHTRQATAYHKADRIENSAAIFVDGIGEAPVRSQAQTWGLPDVEVEELKLGQASGARYLKGLEAAVKGRLDGFLEASYVPEAFGQLGYEPDHVLPYLLDLVSCIPQESRIAYVGARRDMFQRFATAWAAMGATDPIRVPDNAPWLVEVGGDPTPLADWLAQADLFIFEVGAEKAADHVGLSDEERARLWAVDLAFKAAVDADRARQIDGAAPRRTLIINGVHNYFEPQVFAAVSVTLTPFSSRLRHGYFVDPALSLRKAADAVDLKAAAALGMSQPIPKSERRRLADLTASLKAGGEFGPWATAGRQGAEIEALAAAGDTELFKGAGLSDAVLLERLAAARPSRSVPSAAPLIADDAGRGAPTRLARVEDWEDPAWSDLARALFGVRMHDILTRRTRWSWERVTLAQNLLAAVPDPEGVKVLFVGDLPDSLAFALTALGFQVDIASAKALAKGRLEGKDWRHVFHEDGWMTQRPVGLASDHPEGAFYDALVVSQNALFAEGATASSTLLANGVARVRVGGHIGFSADAILSGNGADNGGLSPQLLRDGRVSHALEALVGLAPQGDVDLRITPRTFDRLAPAEYPADGPPSFVVGSPPNLVTSSVFALTKGGGGDAGDWAGLGRVLASGDFSGPTPGRARSVPAPAAEANPAKGGRVFTASDVAALAPQSNRAVTVHFGPMLDRVEALNGARRTPVGLGVASAIGEELAGRADLGELPAGGYELLVEGAIEGLKSPSEVLAVAVVGGGRLLAEHLVSASASGPFRALIAFDVDDDAAHAGGLRVGFKGMGLAEVGLQELVLR